jgi:hypothetical protein
VVAYSDVRRLPASYLGVRVPEARKGRAYDACYPVECVKPEEHLVEAQRAVLHHVDYRHPDLGKSPGARDRQPE